MRSSKKRSRSSQNRPRTLGNIVNRVFDSSGPEGKVRGTPQQIIEKYQMLARDAQLSNDRVAAENFLQHAEHYTRMLAEAMKEMAADQEIRQQQYQQSGGQGSAQGSAQGAGQGSGQAGGQNGGQNGQNGGQNGQPRGDRQDGHERRDRGGERNESRDRGERREFGQNTRDDREFGAQMPAMASDVIDLNEGDDTGLIETPESVARSRNAPETAAVETDSTPREERGPRRPRGPRKPKADDRTEDELPQESAE